MKYRSPVASRNLYGHCTSIEATCIITNCDQVLALVGYLGYRLVAVRSERDNARKAKKEQKAAKKIK
jgi:hypothetical protein